MGGSIELSDIEVDNSSLVLLVRGEVHDTLTLQQLRTVIFFLKRPHTVVPNELYIDAMPDLYNNVDHVVTIRVRMSRLRKRLKMATGESWLYSVGDQEYIFTNKIELVNELRKRQAEK